nr:MAG TPA: hypothetical protein [Caudoviricetes sp.]
MFRVIHSDLLFLQFSEISDIISHKERDNMSIPYQELRFNRKEMRILRKIKRKGKVSQSKIDKKMLGKYLFLFNYNLITFDDDGKSYKLSETGKMFLLRHRESAIKFYLPLFLSIVAIIISIIALIKQ